MMINVASKRLTRAEAEMLGYRVDTCCYPWLGYKGQRFKPTETIEVLTDHEAALVDRLENIIVGVGMGWDLMGLCAAAEEVCAQVRDRPVHPQLALLLMPAHQGHA